MCRDFGLVKSVIHTIWKNRNKTISVLERNGSRIELFLEPEPSDVNEALLKWF